MFCQHCGKEIKEDSKFCKYCGEAISIDVEKAVPEQANKKELAIDSIFKKWYFWVILALCIALIVGLTALITSNIIKQASNITESQTAEKQTNTETEKAEPATEEDAQEPSEKQGSSKDEIDWLGKEYTVVSLYNKKTNKTTDISGGYGLKVDNSGTLVSVTDETGHYWGQENIDDNIDVKIKRYGKGEKYITVYVNDSIAANGENICVDGGTSLLNVHPLMDQLKYDAQTSLDDNDTVKIEVE